ncbi:MAG: signal peptidase I [Synechococcales bacterium]|nr:signal peptidase I [Synechococcales bacterium]
MTIERHPSPSDPPPADPSPETQAAGSPSFWRQLWQAQKSNVQTLAIAIFLAIIIRLFVAEPRFIPSDSMVPTLQVGDRLVIEKVSYRLHPPQVGDIVVFEPPRQLQVFGYTHDQAFIKRVMGVPGQILQVQDHVVYRDGKPLAENYTAEPPDYDIEPFQVPAGQYFVMGDNRNNSNDSHVWGFLPGENIIGRAVFRFWPWPRVGVIRNSAARDLTAI